MYPISAGVQFPLLDARANAEKTEAVDVVKDDYSGEGDRRLRVKVW